MLSGAPSFAQLEKPLLLLCVHVIEQSCDTRRSSLLFMRIHSQTFCHTFDNNSQIFAFNTGSCTFKSGSQLMPTTPECVVHVCVR